MSVALSTIALKVKGPSPLTGCPRGNVFIINLFRSPASAAEFVADPEEAMRTAGLPPVNPAQLQAIAATAAPAGAVLGGGDTIVGLQRAVAEHHNIASPFSPQTTWAPQTQSEFASRNDTEFASRNDTDWASNNDTSLLSPEQSSGANSQQGGLNLGFGDITFGDKTSNTATDGAVIADGDISGPVATGDDAVATGGDNSGDILTGDRSVQGDGNSANSGDVLAGSGSNVVIGEGNDVEDNGNTTSGDGCDGWCTTELAPQTKDQVRCVSQISKAGAKLVKTQFKAHWRVSTWLK